MGRRFRVPSFKKKIAARTSWTRVVRHKLGVKAPRGWGWLTNPKRAAYNRRYNRGCLIGLVLVVGIPMLSAAYALSRLAS